MRIVAIIALVGLVAGCAITTPRGTFSLALQGDQIGMVKDVAVALANVAEDIRQKEAAIEAAQSAQKPNLVSTLTTTLLALRERQTRLQGRVTANVETGQAALSESGAPVPSP